MNSVQLSEGQWHVKAKARVLALWAGRRWSWLGWPLLIVLVLGMLYVLGTMFVSGVNSFYVAFLTDELSRQPIGVSDFEWGIRRQDVQIQAWLFTVVVSLIALVIAFCVISDRIKRSRHRITEQKECERREHFRQGVVETEARFQAILEARRSKVYLAVIHHFKPKVDLPKVLEGCIRLFYIRVTISARGAHPTDDRNIHFSDLPVGHAPYSIIGAPHYDWVVGNPRKLVMMGVMYDLDIAPIHWDPR